MLYYLRKLVILGGVVFLGMVVFDIAIMRKFTFELTGTLADLIAGLFFLSLASEKCWVRIERWFYANRPSRHRR